MLKMMRKYIVCFLLIVVAFFAFDKSVYADNDKCSEESIYLKYKPNIDVNDKKITIKLSPDNNKSLNTTFKYSGIMINNNSSDNKVNFTNGVDTFTKKTDNGKGILFIEIDSVEGILNGKSFELIFKANNDSDCKDDSDKSIEVFLKIEIEGYGLSSATKDVVDEEYLFDTTPVESGTQIDCSKKYDIGSSNHKTSFNAAFCNAKNNAGNNKNKTTYSLKCKDDLYKLKDFDRQGEGYYTNTEYLYYEQTRTNSQGNYSYNLKKGVTAGASLDCVRTCEETLEVKYGPPIASKAGLCFEYKVKIISRVSCYSKTNIPEPKKYSICSPYPVCTRGSSTYKTAGPNDSFDSCIKSCDGGKYTKKCSKKCYSSVYGNSNKTSFENYYNSITATKMAYITRNQKNDLINKHIKKYPCDDPKRGKYEYDSKKSKEAGKSLYVWKGKKSKIGEYYVGDGNLPQYFGGTESGTIGHYAGRWYCENPGDWGTGYNFGVPTSDGFYKRLYNASDPDNEDNYCTDDCKWYGCESDDVYLNYEDYIDDYVNNYNLYENAKKNCKVANSCSTKIEEKSINFNINSDNEGIAKFRISVIEPVDLTKDGVEYNDRVSFPYKTKGSSDYDEIKYKYDGPESKEVSSQKETEGTILFTDNFDFKPNSLYNASYGCYDYDKTNDKKRYQYLYRATWRFPGTYFNIKTGEMSYNSSGKSTDSWYLEEGRYCTSKNEENVNVGWWNKFINYNKNDFSNINYSAYDSQCSNSTDDGTIENPPDSATPYYNIHAEARDFGLFKWDIDVDCFYALNTCLKEPYKVRSINTSDVFPSKKGDSPIEESVGRKPGFNWTASTSGNDKYVIDPLRYITQIQTTSGKIYDSSNLDYSFHLTPSQISNLRDDIKNGLKYNDFSSGEYMDALNEDGKCDKEPCVKNGIPRYYSKVISNFVSNNRRPGYNAVQCNNIKNSDDRSDSEDLKAICDDYQSYKSVKVLGEVKEVEN